MLVDEVIPFEISRKNLHEALEIGLKNNHWLNSPHEGMNNLPIDQSGKMGEKTFYEWCIQSPDINIFYDENNTNQPDGIYEGSISLKKDDLMNVVVTNPKFLILTEKVQRYKYRYENKTARIDKQGKFQHENVKPKKDCDLIVFLDYTPNEIYLTIMDSDFDLSRKHPVFNVTPHIRKDSISGYKFDFSMTQINYGIEAGLTLKINSDTSLCDVHEFIKKFLK